MVVLVVNETTVFIDTLRAVVTSVRVLKRFALSLNHGGLDVGHTMWITGHRLWAFRSMCCVVVVLCVVGDVRRIG